MPVEIYVESTARVTVSDITDFDGATVTAVSVAGTIFDKRGNVVATVTLSDQGAGVWQGSFSPLALTSGQVYSLQLVTTASTGAVLTQRESFTAAYKGF